MNGRLVDDATSLGRGPTLPAVADSYFLDTHGPDRGALPRRAHPPAAPGELERLVPYVEHGGPTVDPKKALATCSGRCSAAQSLSSTIDE